MLRAILIAASGLLELLEQDHLSYLWRQHKQISSVRCEISEFNFQASDFRLRMSDFGFQISDFRFRISDLGFQISDFRFQIPDF